MKWTGPMIAIAGAWLAVAPFALGYRLLSSSATVEAVGVGMFILVFATWAALKPIARPYAGYVLMVVGGWSIVAPFALGYHAVALARNNDIVVGVIVAIVALLDWIRVMPLSHRNVTA